MVPGEPAGAAVPDWAGGVCAQTPEIIAKEITAAATKNCLLMETCPQETISITGCG